MAVYDAKPSVFEANNNGSYTYRWNIRQIQMPSGEGTEERTTTVKWECDEVIVWGTVTRNKYIAAYKSFLTERKAVKEQVDSDCDTLKIQ